MSVGRSSWRRYACRGGEFGGVEVNPRRAGEVSQCGGGEGHLTRGASRDSWRAEKPAARWCPCSGRGRRKKKETRAGFVIYQNSRGLTVNQKFSVDLGKKYST